MNATDHATEPDDGVDEALRARLRPALRFLFDRWWRVQVRGIHRVPRRGGAILVGNHSGAVPVDAAMLSHALDGGAPGSPRRIVRILYDRFVDDIGPVAEMYRRAGGVPARYAEAERMLRRGELVGIFPEGVRGIGKVFADRYRLEAFSSSAARLAVAHRVPIVPFAVIGAEEAYPIVGRSEELGARLRAPWLPITPFFPALGPAGLVPLPTRWTILFGHPLRLDREKRFAGSEDFAAMTARVRRSVEVLVAEGLARRRSVFLG